jgi:glutathione S-transferase
VASEIVVYGPLRNPFVGKVLCALTLKKLEHRVVEPSDPSDYRRLNPETGLLPVADVAGQRIADSHRILDEIDRRWPEPPLVSPDPKIAAAQRQLERWSSETFVFYWERFLRQRMEEEATAAAEEGGDHALARFGIFRRQPLASSGSRYASEYAQRVADLANFLGSRPFFYADRISRADLAAYSFLSTGRVGAMSDTVRAVDRHPTLLEWLDRVAEQTRGASMP